MSTQKAKFELYSRLQGLGFTYEEAVSLRRIEMTLHSWAERECGDGSNWAIERDEKTDAPYNVYHGEGKARPYRIADREKGALRRLKTIVDARNARQVTHDAFVEGVPVPNPEQPNFILPYYQGDCRGCMVYLVRRSDIPEGAKFESCYTNGLAVCA